MTSVAELSRQMESERRDLDRNLSELKTRAEHALDWREQVQKHPALLTAAALGAGMLLAQVGRGRSRRMLANHDQRAVPRGPGAFDFVRDALKTTAATVAAGLLAEFIPGFREEHARRQR